jgi:hypothetical protein
MQLCQHFRSDNTAYKETQRDEWANNVFTRHREKLECRKKKERKECKVKTLKELS